MLTVTLKEVFLPLYFTVIFCVPSLASLVGEHEKPLEMVFFEPLEYFTVSLRPLVESLLPSLYFSLVGLDFTEIEETLFAAAYTSVPLNDPPGASITSIASIRTRDRTRFFTDRQSFQIFFIISLS